MRHGRVVRLSVLRVLLAASFVGLAGPLAGAPSNVSVMPSSGPPPGNGFVQTFNYVFSHPGGFANIASTQMLINATFNAANACYLYVEPATNQLYLQNDAGAAGLWPPVTLGTPGTTQNSQCVVDAGASLPSSGTGINLTVNVALTFKPAFAGIKTNFMTAFDGTDVSPWESRGTWTVPGNHPPTNGSVAPSSGPPPGNGVAQTFNYVFSDLEGFANIASTHRCSPGLWARMSLHSGWGPCYRSRCPR